MGGRYDLAAVRRQVGDKAFHRGQAYVDEERVSLTAVTSDVVRAVVEGGDDYPVTIRGTGDQIVGYCGCPAFDMGPCKHIACVAIFVNSAGEEKMAKLADLGRRVREHLLGLSSIQLTDLIMRWAAQDAVLHLDLLFEAGLMSAEEFDNLRGLGD